MTEISDHKALSLGRIPQVSLATMTQPRRSANIKNIKLSLTPLNWLPKSTNNIHSMSVATYSHARLDRRIAPKNSGPRPSLRPPLREVAFRREHIAEYQMALVAKPQGSSQSKVAYDIYHEAGASAFTASGRKYNGRECREFRDKSGLPLFEIYKKPWYSPDAYTITLPGSNDAESTIAKASPEWGADQMSILYRNGAGDENRTEGSRGSRLTVKKHGNLINLFDVVDDDGRKIIELRESINHNDRLALRRNSRSKSRPALDLMVTPGVDIALVRAHTAGRSTLTDVKTGLGDWCHRV